MIEKYVAVVQMITQYFDMLKDVGSTNGNSTIFLNHSPGSLGSLSEEVSPLLARRVYDVLVWSPISAESWNELRGSPSRCYCVDGAFLCIRCLTAILWFGAAAQRLHAGDGRPHSGHEARVSW